MVIVRLHHGLVADFPLYPEVKTARVGRLEPCIYRDRNQEVCRNREVHGEVAKPAPEEVSRLLAYCGAGSVRELLCGQAAQGLHVALAHDGVERDFRGANAVQMIDSEKRQARRRARSARRRDLRIGQHRRGA